MAELAKNQIYEAVCSGYTSTGDGVVRIEGRAVFVKGLIDGERCRVRILRAGRNAVYGKIEELLTASPHRVEPECPAYGKCGGCALRHMDYQEELSFKRRRVADALKRIGGVETEPLPVIGCDRTYGYRNKTICSVERIDDRAVTGFYRPRTHDIVPVERCGLEQDYAARAGGAVRRWMDKFGIPAFDPSTGRGVRRVFCRYGETSRQGQTVLVTGVGRLGHVEELSNMLLESCPETVSLMRNVNSAPGDTVLGREFVTLWGSDHIEDSLLGLTFRLAPDSFYQVNSPQAERLYEKALELAQLDSSMDAVDLYCGAGTITMCLAKKARRAVGIEIVESAVEAARISAKANGIDNVKFICGDAAKAAASLLEEGFRPAVVTVDPPRRGLSPDAPSIIASLSPERIVYVSCDPATLARDIKSFASLGYQVSVVQPVDMFPRTYHVETVALLSKLNAEKHIDVEPDMDELDLTAAEKKAI